MATTMMTDDLNRAAWTKSRPQVERRPGMGIVRLADLYARVALGTGFLSSVADRFGLWGNYGHRNVSWGDFGHFIQYTGMVNSFLPARAIPVVAWAATVAETVLGLALLLGLYKRYAAIGSAVLLLTFALAMTVSFGVESAISYSVFTASAAALLVLAAQCKRAESESAKAVD
jgi:uncharacterized membrane protein YphA (DoxX/SURF4 family)